MQHQYTVVTNYPIDDVSNHLQKVTAIAGYQVVNQIPGAEVKQFVINVLDTQHRIIGQINTKLVATAEGKTHLTSTIAQAGPVKMQKEPLTQIHTQFLNNLALSLKGQTVTTANFTPPKTKSNANVIAAVIIGLAVFYLVAAQIGSRFKSTNAYETYKVKNEAVIYLNSSDLTYEYEANEVNADQTYKGKTLQVTGQVENIGKDILDHAYITLSGHDEYGFRHVQCYIKDLNALSQLSKGQTVTVKGKCAGLMMNVLMRDCQLM
jgi:hypothetical protein